MPCCHIILHAPTPTRCRYLIWQEDWTSNPFARSKFIKGKIAYQRDPRARDYYCRPYHYKA